MRHLVIPVDVKIRAWENTDQIAMGDSNWPALS